MILWESNEVVIYLWADFGFALPFKLSAPSWSFSATFSVSYMGRSSRSEVIHGYYCKCEKHSRTKFLLSRINLAVHVFSRFRFTATKCVNGKGAVFLQCNNTAGVQSILGSSEYGALCRSQQSNKATPPIPPMDR